MLERSPEIIPAREITGQLCPILPTAIDPDAVAVLRRLHQAGHRAYLVGGCVRDLLLGGTPKDFDIATSARPRQVKKLFRNARIIGRRFRLVHVMFGPRKQIEVSTFRRDPGDGGGVAAEPELPAHDFGDEPNDPAAEAALESAAGNGQQDEGSVDGDGDGDGDDEPEDLLIREDNVYGSEAEDAVRRDFTINGLFYELETESVLDYVGGVEDLRRRTLRTIGEASRRVREDPVRILRAVKFSTRLDLALDPLLASAMAEHHEDVRKSAAPRVFEEILRMLGGASPEKSVEVLVGLGVMRVLFPELGLKTHADDEEDPRLARLLARLRTVGAIDRGKRSLPTAIYVGVLFYDELLARLVGTDQPHEGPHHPPSQALEEFLRPLGQRCRMAKRDTARVRAMFLALRRIDPNLAEPRGKRRRRRGGLGDFVKREFFEDALLLLRIVATAEGRELAAVEEWERKRDELLAARHDGAHSHHPQRPPHRPTRESQHESSPEPSREPRAQPSQGTAPDSEPREEDGAAAGEPGRRRRRRRRRRGGSALPPAGHPVLDVDDESEPA